MRILDAHTFIKAFALAALILLFSGFMPFISNAMAHAPAGQHAKTKDLGTGAAFDRNGVLWVVTKETDHGNQTVVLQSSSDMGKTWTTPRRVMQSPEPVAASGEARPHIAFGPAGELYITYTSTIARPHIGNIRFIRSLDGGKTFSEPLTVQKNTDAVTHSFESIVVDKAGRIYVAWLDGRDANQARTQKKAYAGSALYYAVSNDRGASFPNDFKIADHSCECCRIGLALPPDAGPVAFWRHVFPDRARDHAVAQLRPDGKASALERATFDDWRVDACPHHGPSLDFSPDGRRHQVWFDGRETVGGVWYAWASPAGKLSRPVRIGTPQASHADVAVQGNQIAVAWKEFDGMATSVVARWSDDDGKSWREAKMGDTLSESDKPYLLTAPHGIVLIWRTQKEGIRVMPVTGTQP